MTTSKNKTTIEISYRVEPVKESIDVEGTVDLIVDLLIPLVSGVGLNPTRKEDSKKTQANRDSFRPGHPEEILPSFAKKDAKMPG